MALRSNRLEALHGLGLGVEDNDEGSGRKGRDWLRFEGEWASGEGGKTWKEVLETRQGHHQHAGGA